MTELTVEKASQICHIVQLHFSTIEEAGEFYEKLETSKPITLKLSGAKKDE